jgi:hypothetical protein
MKMLCHQPPVMGGLAYLRLLRLNESVLKEMIDDYDQVPEELIQVFIAMYLTYNHSKTDIT